jgi:ectoine hydroxylase-related dioxygenase (phytanoyl-CoA dioxygenase family)
VTLRRRSKEASKRRNDYAVSGYLGPLRAPELDAGAAREVLGAVQSLTKWPECRNRHLDVPAVASVCSLPSVIDAVRDLLGPDLLLWRSNLFGMEASQDLLPWHRDEYRGLLVPDDAASHCSVQLNLTDAGRDNYVAILPGSHQWDAAELADRRLRLRAEAGGTSMWDVPSDAPSQAVRLRVGEFYIFHPMLLHASVLRPSRQTSARMSVALRVTTPRTKVVPAAFDGTPSRDRCVLLSGRDSGLNQLGTWAA